MKLSLFLLALAPIARAAVLAIDYGAEFTKISLVKPGVPFDVVLDKDSKRKIHSAVAWKRDERVFGAESANVATRFPTAYFPYSKPLLGQTDVRNPALYPSPPTLSSNGTLTFAHPTPSDASNSWSPETLLSMQLSYARSLAQDLAGGEAVTSAVLTVPSSFTQHQRKAMRDAMDIAGLSCLAMISEGGAVGINYAMTRSFGEEKEYHLVYDSGALSTAATLLAFYQTSAPPPNAPKSKTLINTTHVEVVAFADVQVGGVEFDQAVRALLLADFKKQKGDAVKGIEDDARAMRKLWKEASRVKHVLSANQESGCSVESLYDEVDYRSRLSRSAFEEAVTSLAPRFAEPIHSVISQVPTLTIENITSVILFGGNTRVPLVLAQVKDAVGAERIAQNVNADEGAVLGAAFHGAALSRQFKTKDVRLADRLGYEIVAADGELVFGPEAKAGDKALVVLRTKVDEVSVKFKYSSPNVAIPEIAQVDIVGITAALANFTGSDPVIKLSMKIDSAGLLRVANAVLTTEVEEVESGGVTGKLKGLFGGGKKDKEAETAAAEDEEAVPETPTPKKIALKSREHQLGLKSMTADQKRTARAQLATIAAVEKSKAAREEARNLLEGYLYRLQNLLSPETSQKALHDFAKVDERKRMTKLLEQTFEWLGEEAESANEKTLRKKRADLEALEAPIIHRYTEFIGRPKAIEDFQQAMFAARHFFVEASKNNTEAIAAVEAQTDDAPATPPKFTPEELEVVEKLLKEFEHWIDTGMSQQVVLDEDMTSEPLVLVKDLESKGKLLQSTVLRLINKRAPKAPRKSTTSTTATSTTSATVGSGAESTQSAETTSSEMTEPAQATPSPLKHEEL